MVGSDLFHRTNRITQSYNVNSMFACPYNANLSRAFCQLTLHRYMP